MDIVFCNVFSDSVNIHLNHTHTQKRIFKLHLGVPIIACRYISVAAVSKKRGLPPQRWKVQLRNNGQFGSQLVIYLWNSEFDIRIKHYSSLLTCIVTFWKTYTVYLISFWIICNGAKLRLYILRHLDWLRERAEFIINITKKWTRSENAIWSWTLPFIFVYLLFL